MELNFSVFPSSKDKLNFGDDVDNNFTSYRTFIHFPLERFSKVYVDAIAKEYSDERNVVRFFRILFVNKDKEVVGKSLSRYFNNGEKILQSLINIKPASSGYITTVFEVLVEERVEEYDIGLQSIKLYFGESDDYH